MVPGTGDTKVNKTQSLASESLGVKGTGTRTLFLPECACALPKDWVKVRLLLKETAVTGGGWGCECPEVRESLGLGKWR